MVAVPSSKRSSHSTTLATGLLCFLLLLVSPQSHSLGSDSARRRVAGARRLTRKSKLLRQSQESGEKMSDSLPQRPLLSWPHSHQLKVLPPHRRPASRSAEGWGPRATETC